jgi:uncharacterized linocin/CFP29 family protein
MPNDPQVPWTNEQWARVNQVVQEEAARARVAASFLPLSGPLPPDTDFIRAEIIPPGAPLTIEDRATIRLATLQVTVPVRSAQMADPELASVLALFRRAANVIARLEDAVVFRGLLQRATGTMAAAAAAAATAAAAAATAAGATAAAAAAAAVAAAAAATGAGATVAAAAAAAGAAGEAAAAAAGLGPPAAAAAGITAAAAAAAAAAGAPFEPPGGLPPRIWEIQGGQPTPGLWAPGPPPPPWPWIAPFQAPDAWQWVSAAATPGVTAGDALVRSVSDAIGNLEGNGHFGPFAVVLGQGLFLVAQTPNPAGSLVLPQDRIIPFLGGGSLLRSSTLNGGAGVVVALGGAPMELVIAADMSVQFLQITNEPNFLFRVREKIALRIKQADAIVTLYWPPPIITAVAASAGNAVITGENFLGATELLFGQPGLSGFTIASDTEIRLPLPAGDPGDEVYVTVTTPGGTGPDQDTPANRFTY